MFFKRIAGLIIISVSLNAYAIEPVAKEDTTHRQPKAH